mmetsp:Transcript_13341/g.28963  ORF Transcript_13341/g.28963 Transcript_13341/m.28963 type:complete len:414 (+) Transcript_13341:431-1672(+)|eukprot:CAMPEP_0172298160 /NCGR_PEP_ID=MMETSP1058-20130122/932_1 /TAXON_ID=83371 /ORGANISM="Detonula confervacea, Strain CCMP 353" /LENGTH=413 /DNA_ID=CAMNT_0013007409 /DNA_START=429 /DNA_END=1670 /DNA_ORIENTATION=-
MIMAKRVWPCLLLLAIHTRPTDSNTADVSALNSLDDNDDVHVVSSRDTRVPYLDDNGLDDEENATASIKIVDKSAVTREQQQQQQPAFLRKNNTNPSTGTGIKRKELLRKAFNRAIGGGIPGAIAGVVQVFSLMWLRTVINYQYRYGSSFHQALTTLYGMGGIRRLYSGITFALIQAPLSRFISTAANDGISVLLQNFNWGPGREVVVAAFVVGFFRIMLMPIDTCKTVLQIESKKGLSQLLFKVRRGHVHLLYSGALANAASSFMGHYPWFYMYNLLSKSEMLIHSIPWVTGRNALIGFISSIVSDTVANSMRVIKTTKQALGSTRSSTTYAETISLILAVDGWRGLFGRGLKTRIVGNALQSILFTVVWRGLSERWRDEKKDDNISTSIDDNSSAADDNVDAEKTEYETKR